MSLVIIFTIVIFTLLGGLTAVYFKDKLHLILGFSAGAILAISLFCLIPEAIEIGEKFYDKQLIFLYIVIGFISYMIFERFFHNHEIKHECENLSHSGKFAVFALILHSIIDGIAVGLALQGNVVIATIIIIAILSHKFADGLSTVGVIFGNNGKNIEAFIFLIISAFAPIIGIFLSFFIIFPENILGLLFALFGGFFLYLSASDLLIESYHCHKSFWTTLSTCVGISIIYIAIQIAGEFL